MGLRLYNSLGSEQQEFRTVAPDEVRVYVCGVTPYDVTHLGHAFSYVHFDVLRRYLQWQGYRVRYVQNVTDIDDDMIMVSRREGRPIAEIRDENDAIFRADMDRLNVLRPTAYPFATSYMDEIIETTQRIIDNGHAYEVAGNMYFDVSSFPRYGRLNAATNDELLKLENPEAKHAEMRRGPLDFLLWQTVEPGDPSWDSPWGPGRPGWSIECTAMASTLLGTQIDIHGGGRDLRFPHHENEIAQAECANNVEPFSGWWMHNGMLQLEGTKMSKSLGNLVLARDLLARVPAEQLRLCLLTEHYRTDANYQDGVLDGVAPVYERLRKVALEAPGGDSSPPDRGHPVLQRFTEHLDNDMDVPGAITSLDEAAVRIVNGSGESSDAAAIAEACRVLGLAFAGARGPALGDFDPE